jgi:C-terminal processing protease CtpA/Prc
MGQIIRGIIVGLIWLGLLGWGASTEAQQNNDEAEAAAPLTERSVENLVAYAQIFGVVRYFYAGDAAATTDWDAFALAHIAEVETAADPDALAATLRGIFSPVAPGVQFAVTGEDYKPLIRDVRAEAVGVTFWVRPGWVRLNSQSRALNAPERVTAPFQADGGLPVTVAHTLGATDELVTVPVSDPAAPYEAALAGGVRVRVPLAVYVNAAGATLPLGGVASRPNISANFRDRQTRLADVIITWAHFEHLFAYWDVLDGLGVDWETALREGLTAAAMVDTVDAYNLVLRRLTAQLNDGHTRVSAPVPLVNFGGNFSLPFSFDVVEGQLIVTTVDPRSYAGAIRRGDAVLAWDGQPTDALLAEINAENGPVGQFGVFTGMWARVVGQRDTAVALRVQPFDGGAPFDETVQRSVIRSHDNLPIVFEPLRDNREPRPPIVAALGDGVMYVDLTRLAPEQFPVLLEVLGDAEGLVIDMRGYPRGNHPLLVIDIRGYPRGNHPLQLLGYIARAPLAMPPFLLPIFTAPGQRDPITLDASWSPIELIEPQLTDNVAWIINANGAVSHAESIMGIVENGGAGQIVGEPTAGANGNIAILRLPSGFTVSYTSVKVTKRDGSPLFTVGVTPTLPATRTIAGVAAGRDELLEAAFAAVGGETLAVKSVELPASALFNPDTVSLTAYTNAETGFSTVIPDGWESIGGGSYTPDGAATVLKVSLEDEYDDVAAALAALTGRFNLEATLFEARTTDDGALTFTIYEYRARQMRIVVALADAQPGDAQSGRDGVYVVALQAQTSIYEKLVPSVFLPAVRQFRLE